MEKLLSALKKVGKFGKTSVVKSVSNKFIDILRSFFKEIPGVPEGNFSISLLLIVKN